MKFSISNGDKYRGGIYIIESSITDDSYIGATINFYKRFMQHKNPHTDSGILLEEYKVKFGIECLTMRCLCMCDREILQQQERKYINELLPTLNMNNTSLSVLRARKKKDNEIISKICASDKYVDTDETVGTWRKKMIRI